MTEDSSSLSNLNKRKRKSWKTLKSKFKETKKSLKKKSGPTK